MKPSDSYLYPYFLAKRAKMSAANRAKPIKQRVTRWVYPYTEEVRFRRLVKAYLKVFVTVPMLEAAEKGYFELTRNDSVGGYHADSLIDVQGTITRIGLAAFPDNKFLNKVADSISRQSDKQWGKFVRQATGVDITRFETDEERQVAADWAEESIDKLRNFSNIHAKKVNKIIADGVADDKEWSEIKEEIKEENEKVTNAQANYIARDSTGELSSRMQETLSKEAGINAYKWNTSRDRKVRGHPFGLYPKTKYSHYIMNRQLRRWSDNKISTDGGRTWRAVRGREEPRHVGRAYNCRCTGEPFFDILVRAADKELSKR